MAFKQAVGMRCTQEQYNKDLKQPLLAMGYVEHRLNWDETDNIFIVNNLANILGHFSNVCESEVYGYNRYVIKKYNPELYLALAAITDNPIGIKDEWWVCINSNTHNFTEGKLYQQKTQHLEDVGAFIDNSNKYNGWCGNNFERFKKPTYNQILTHFNIPMDIITITKSDAKKLYDLACNDWKAKMDEYLKPFMFNDTIDFNASLLKEIQNACTAEQLPVFIELFGDLNDNAFVCEFDDSFLDSTSQDFFGEKGVMEIATAAADEIGRHDLNGKSLYFSSDVELILHKTNLGGTVVEIKNK